MREFVPQQKNPGPAARVSAFVSEGLRYQQSGVLKNAMECYRRALHLDPKCFDALQLLGVAQFRSGEVETGIGLLRRALSLEPNHAPTLNNLGNALRAAGHWHEAIAAYRQSVALTATRPRPMTLRNLGSALLEVGELSEAAALLTQARSLDDRDPELHCWIGHLDRMSNRPSEAVEAYRRALTLNPSLTQAYRGLGSALRDLGQEKPALDAYGQALKLEPGILDARVFRSNLALSLAAWQEWEADRRVIVDEASAAPAPVDPFTIFYLTDSRAVLRRYGDAFGALTLGQAPKLPPLPKRTTRSERIRVAYVSGDIRDHAVAHLTAGIFRRHDRARFDVRVYSINDDPSAAAAPVRQKIAMGCERFVALGRMSDAQLAGRLRADDNDIIVDLAGYTYRGQPRALAARPAPVQVNWLGYPGTLGASFIDYLVADEFSIPPGTESAYAEKIVRLPETFQPNDCERPIGDNRSRTDYGLPDSALVLCSFNNAQKINPPLFDTWMQILRAVPDAVLWLNVRATAADNLRREAAARGVDPQRLVFAQPVPSNADHLARYRLADLALDTFPYTSHTTASDALWAGCPLIGLTGESLASRVSGSVLRAVGLPELVTDSLASYRDLVLALAADRHRLQELRERLAANRLTCALFDTTRFVRALEAAFTLMHERALAGLPPTHLRIERESAELAPRPNADSLIEAGVRYQQQNQFATAAESYQRALDLEPQNSDALQLLGGLRIQTGDLAGAVGLLEGSLAIKPRQFAALANLGEALRLLSRPDEAIAAFRRALQLDPTHSQLLTKLGGLLFDSGDIREAAGCFAQALERDQDNPEIYTWVGQLYRQLGRPDAAVEQFRHALHLSPRLEKALGLLGVALDEAGDAPGALEALRSFEAVAPATISTRVLRANAALRCADWQDWTSDVAALAISDFPVGDAADPLRLMHVPTTPELIRKAAETLLTVLPASAPLPQRAEFTRDGDRRLRVAYLSPDFRHHAVGNVVREVFEQHDRARFEIFAYGWGPRDETSSRSRIASACEHFQDVSDISDRAIAEKLRADGVDIAVDLAGHTAYSRPMIFAVKPAPVQVSWLGYPGTTGASYMDYLVADPFTIPEGMERHYSEQIIRLPHTYLPYDRSRPVAQPRPREEYGLPADAVVLGCFAQIRKINPLTFDVWMDVLRENPRAVLWLASDHSTVVTNLHREAEARGVSSQRLVFAASVPDPGDHLARYRVMDLALDTFPYGSHSTAADALWAGCPLLGVVGDAFMSRVSGSILRAAGFPELVARDLEEYQRLMKSYASDPARIVEKRAAIEAARDRCPLFDTVGFVKGLESAYEQMWARHASERPTSS